MSSLQCLCSVMLLKRHVPLFTAARVKGESGVVYPICVLCCGAASVAGADLPQCELYGRRSCVTLSDWCFPYLVQSAARVTGVRGRLGWLTGL